MGPKYQNVLRRCSHLEVAVITLGQYVMSSSIIPVCCVSIVKEMHTKINENAHIISQLIAKRMTGTSKFKV